jgi:hypothetical protein
MRPAKQKPLILRRTQPNGLRMVIKMHSTKNLWVIVV